MPDADSFLDTNVLLYAVSTDPAEAGKTRVARRLLARETWGWSAQVMAEFINVSTSARRKYPWPRAKVRRALKS